MEEEDNQKTPSSGRGSLFRTLVMAFGIFGTAAAVFSFYALLPSTFNTARNISLTNPYNYFFLDISSSVVLLYGVLIVSIIFITGAFLTMFIGRENVSVGVRESNRLPFLRFLSVFILIELILSVVSPYISAQFTSNPVLNLPLATQNFVFISSSVSQTIILQFLPISAMIAVYLGLRGKLTVDNFLNPDRSIRNVEYAVMAIGAVVATALTSSDAGSALLNYVSFFLMNFIYIRYGLLRAMLSGFTISQFNLILQMGPSTPFPALMYIFLLVWSFIGTYWAVSTMTRYSQQRAREAASRAERARGGEQQGDNRDNGTQQAPPQKGMVSDPKAYWIRSTCPSCGNYNFQIMDDMSLECKNCHQKIDSDAVGEFNIRAVRSRI